MRQGPDLPSRTLALSRRSLVSGTFAALGGVLATPGILRAQQGMSSRVLTIAAAAEPTSLDPPFPGPRPDHQPAVAHIRVPRRAGTGDGNDSRTRGELARTRCVDLGIPVASWGDMA
jgi:hypothetical protein